MRLARRAALGLLSGLAAGGVVGCTRARHAGAGVEPESQPAPRSEAGPHSYRYGDHPSQYAELSLPAGSGPVPVVVIVHGGFWQAAYGAELGRPLAAELTVRGWAALNVEYRRLGSNRTAGGGGWPRTGLDVAAAVDALSSRGQQLAGRRLDLTRVVGLGHSAGGQLVGWLAARTALPAEAPGADPVVRLTGVVAQAGVMDLVGAARERVGGSAVPDLMGGLPNRLAQAYGWASPLARLPTGVASVCVHGVSDATVPLNQSERFAAAARRAGDDSELRRFQGGHLELITVGTPGWTLSAQAVTDLLSR